MHFEEYIKVCENLSIFAEIFIVFETLETLQTV